MNYVVCSPTKSSWCSIKGYFSGKDYYSVGGVKILAKKGTGEIRQNENGTISISNAANLSIIGTSKSDDIYVKNSDVKIVSLGNGSDKLVLDGCHTEGKMFGTTITTGSNGFRKEKDKNLIIVNGDLHGNVLLQQNDNGCHKDGIFSAEDTLIITGTNYAEVTVDQCDKVKIKGQNKGTLKNVATNLVFIPM